MEQKKHTRILIDPEVCLQILLRAGKNSEMEFLCEPPPLIESPSNNPEIKKVSEPLDFPIMEQTGSLDCSTETLRVAEDIAREIYPNVIDTFKLLPLGLAEMSRECQAAICNCLIGPDKFRETPKYLFNVIDGFENGKIQWYGTVKSLMSLVYELELNNIITSSKTFLTRWISNKVEFVENGIPTTRSPNYLNKILKPCFENRLKSEEDGYIDIREVLLLFIIENREH